MEEWVECLMMGSMVVDSIESRMEVRGCCLAAGSGSTELAAVESLCVEDL